jgi:hypothetical protein
MDGPERLPTFGVPRRISAKDAVFVAVAGIGLTLVLVGLMVTIITDFDRDNVLHQLAVLGVLGLGPASAYYLARWLRANRIALPIGCGALTLWVVLLALVGMWYGWLGVCVLVAATGAVMWLVRRRRRTAR